MIRIAKPPPYPDDDQGNVQCIIDGARTMPDRILIQEFVDMVDRAIDINNSGLFKVAGLLMDEFRAFRNLIKRAVAEAEARR
jgi:hypothetical protein